MERGAWVLHSMGSLVVMAAVGTLVAGQAAALTLHVATDGDDRWSGRLERPNGEGTDGPLASLQGARDTLRRLQGRGAAAGAEAGAAVRVVVQGGTYALREPLVFGPQDSGTEEAPVSYEAAPGARVVLSGGREITGFVQSDDGLWTAQLPEVADGLWYPEQLWVNGRRAIRARTPNGVRLGETYVPRYFYIAGAVGFGADPLTGERADLQQRAFRANPGDLAVFEGLGPTELNDANILVYYAWETARVRPVAVDEARAQVYTTPTGVWKYNWLGCERYHVENVRAALDEPGEWFLGRDGTLTYWPLPDEDMATAQVVAPVLSEFVRFEGAAPAGPLVEHVTLRGLHFEYAGYSLEAGGHADGQAAVSVPAVIMLDGARKVTLEDCEVAHTGTYGVWFRTGCEDCTLRRTELRDLGAGGVKIGTGAIPPDDGSRTQRIVCDNNLIHGGGRIFPGAVGVWLGQSGDNEITHNDISDLFYTGISAGWSWGYSETISKRNRIEYNQIHHLGWGTLSDMGGVYTLGDAEGTRVSHNVIHDVWSYDKYGWGGLGLYNDEGTTHITMESNLVYHTRDMLYHQHYGKENTIRNNIFYDGGEAQLSVHRVEPHLSATFERNIVLFDSGKLFWAAGLEGRQLAFDRNLYWDASGTPLDFMGMTFEQWQALGQDTHSVVADPQFADPAKLDFTLAADSPALKLGLVPFDWKEAGLYGEAAWVAKAEALSYPEVVFAPDPPAGPPLELDEGFEDYPVGGSYGEGQTNVEGKGDSILVTDEEAAEGRQCLKLQDAAGLQYSFNPHLVLTPNYLAGTARCVVDVMVEPGEELVIEWRDWSGNPYKVGPSVKLTDGGLSANGKRLADAPVRQWLRLELSMALGDKADGTWSLKLMLPGEEEQEFTGLPCGDPSMQKVTWVGFISNATVETAAFLDNLKLIESED